jgi:hypothetical protein
MKRLVLLIIAMCSLGFCFFPAWGGQRDSTELRRGMVFYNGRELEPPFVFTGHGTDTLYLNGIPYAPVRKKKEKPGPPYVPSELRLKQNALSKKAMARSKEGESMEDRLALLKETYLSSSLVDSVRDSGEYGIFVYWKDSPIFKFEGVTLSPDPPPTDSVKAAWLLESHIEDEKSFWETYNRGGVILFGMGYGHIYVPRSRKDLIIGLITKLAQGDTLTAEERKGTFLNNSSVYEALSEQLQPKRGE